MITAADRRCYGNIMDHLAVITKNKIKIRRVWNGLGNHERDVAFLLNYPFCTYSVQVSQYAFAVCSFRQKKSDPTEFVQLDGFTIDYMPEPDQGMNISKCSVEVV
ncbi:unnamed protein product [Heligmosomoides polygyrus]|uniref:DDE_Tnp_1_7 domain-containing protein n=1 Tax=Heligmosomoides polygyrus TaxID=6339 RepID=A0A183GWZ7_HELPZ|nr:unnamed protein product [Heligmosomoides polygyrus]